MVRPVDREELDGNVGRTVMQREPGAEPPVYKEPTPLMEIEELIGNQSAWEQRAVNDPPVRWQGP